MTMRDVAGELLTDSAEDYLKAIFALSADAPAATSKIAERLDLAPASVSGMIRRLSDQGLLDHEPYRGVVLTEAGRRIALRMLRRHRLIETYLVEFLGYQWDDVHAQAETLEHSVSDDLVERMAAALGHPLVDPHGDPIPGPDGVMHEPNYLVLATLECEQPVVIRRVGTNDPDRLRYLGELGLHLGSVVSVIAREPFDGPVTLQVAGQTRVIASDLAELLLCVREGVQ